MLKSVFVIGGSGYIGSHVVKKLLLRKIKVTCSVRSQESADKVARMGASVIFGDLENPTTIAEAAKDFDISMLLAVSRDKNRSVLESGINDALLSMSKNYGKGYIFTSGVWVYGDCAGNSLIDENAPVKPLPIAQARASEDLKIREFPGARAVILRPGNVYGGSSVGSIRSWILAASQSSAENPMVVAGNGCNSLPWIHVDDIAEAYCCAADFLHSSGTANSVCPVFNVTDNEQFHSVDDVVSSIFKALSKKKSVEYIDLEEAERRELGPRAATQAVNQKISSCLGMSTLHWKPKGVSLLNPSMMKKMVDSCLQK